MEDIQEYPKMLYKHPDDKTKEHSFVTVNTEEEEIQALDNGYHKEAHVPDHFEENGIKTEQPTDNPEVISEKQDSPKDILEHEHLNDKADGGKIEE